MIQAISIFAILIGFHTAAAQQVTCDGFRYPNPEDCDWIAARSVSNEGSGDYCGGSSNEECLIWTASDRNCIITECLLQESCISRASTDGIYQLVKSSCIEDANAGGRFDPDVNGVYTLEVYNNPEWQPASAKRINPGSSDPNVTKTRMSIEEWEEIKKNQSSVRPETGLVERGTARQTHRSRQTEGDDSFTVYTDAVNVEYPDGGKIVGVAPSGSAYVIRETEEYGYSMSVSASVSAGFADIIEVEVGFEFSASRTYSTTEGFNVNVDCPSGQDGVIYYYPLFRKVTGVALPSRTELVVWIPMDTNLGNYRVQCLG